jgi:Domain of unknown function (DUF4873)
MSSYVGPAQLVVAGRTCDVEVNLHEFVDLTDPPRSRWRGVVVNASFEPASFEPAEAPDVHLRIPGRGEAVAVLRERRLVGDGHAPFAGAVP